MLLADTCDRGNLGRGVGGVGWVLLSAMVSNWEAAEIIFFKRAKEIDAACRYVR